MISAWLGKAYSKLYLAFRCEPFALVSAESVLACSSNLARVILSRLRSVGLASTFSRTGRRRLYRLLDPETWVVLMRLGWRTSGESTEALTSTFSAPPPKSLIERYGQDLVSVVLYGSVARGRCT